MAQAKNEMYNTWHLSAMFRIRSPLVNSSLSMISIEVNKTEIKKKNYKLQRTEKVILIAQ